MNPILEQIRFMHKIGGIGRLLRLRKKHALGLKLIRGYAATTCFWTLSNVGLLDNLLEKGAVDLKEFAQANKLDLETLRSICEYLDGIKVLDCENDRCMLDVNGKILLEEPRGLFDLLYGYEPVFTKLEALARSQEKYGRDVIRRGDAVAKGSGELGRQFPFLAMRQMVYDHGFRRVLDLGCGDLEFVFLLCERAGITAAGVDSDPAAIECARRRLEDGASCSGRVTVSRADMFDVEHLAELFPDIDAITAIDVLHEYVYGGVQPVIKLLGEYKRNFPQSALVVAEFFKLPRVWLRRIPTTTLEHHLFHSLTKQEILPIGQWIDLFQKSGYGIVDKKLVHGIGHAYFVLR
ncbi:MAG: methyltransferase domain-containing protein [Candidatus Abyssobacteria bacterium SURF_5]|uniref:Methyltransferase domain-containing protein n=1 Tax=Abyssobacteria bacterium (strain SURF_5) TaxID=2093360 RepID=A0A3A4NMW1_ABYX5|nr:MAG: methyltransferase domain-containing protein [Candidatus Abyssubacteria bacterium SURF_5]